MTNSQNPTCRMGVLGLQKFLKKNVRNEYCREVGVKELAKGRNRKRIRAAGRWMELSQKWLCCFKPEELLMGGQMQEFFNKMKDFVAAFQVTEDPNAFVANF